MYEKLLEMSRNNDYTTGSLFDFLYHQSKYKIIVIDISWQTSTCIPQQINFVCKLEEDDGANIFLSLESNKKLY